MRVVIEGKISATRPISGGVSIPGAIPSRFPYIADGRAYILGDNCEWLIFLAPRQLQHRVGDRVRVTFEIEEEPRRLDPDPELLMGAEQG